VKNGWLVRGQTYQGYSTFIEVKARPSCVVLMLLDPGLGVSYLQPHHGINGWLGEPFKSMKGILAIRMVF
jgi:hypothetical protein